MILRLAAIAALFVSFSSHAAGVDDLKSALLKLAAPQAIKAQISLKVQSKNGEGKDAKVESGAATVGVEEDAQGLHLLYSPELLAKLRAEDAAQDQDPNAQAPTNLALKSLAARDLRAMTTAAETLTRMVAAATYKSESATTWNGQAARLLSFETGMGKVRERDRKYIKSVQGTLQIWIAADGTPLEARTQQEMSGRAMLVISFEMRNSDRLVFARHGDRLIALTREQSSGGSGAGEKGETTNSYSLQLQR